MAVGRIAGHQPGGVGANGCVADEQFMAPEHPKVPEHRDRRFPNFGSSSVSPSAPSCAARRRAYLLGAKNHPCSSEGSVAILCPTHRRNGRHSETNLGCHTLRSEPLQENRRGLSRYTFRSSTHGGTARHPRLALPRSESNLSSEEPVAARKAACAFPRICPAPPPPPP